MSAAHKPSGKFPNSGNKLVPAHSYKCESDFWIASATNQTQDPRSGDLAGCRIPALPHALQKAIKESALSLPPGSPLLAPLYQRPTSGATRLRFGSHPLVRDAPPAIAP